MPLLSGNRAIKLPLYEKINEVDQKDFLFKPALERYKVLSKKYTEILKTTSMKGDLRDFFSLEKERPSNLPISSTEHDEKAQPQEPDNQVQSLFNEYYNSRKNFVIEYGY